MRHNIKIILAEDDIALRKLVALILRRQGWEVIEAADGQEALKLLQREDADLVLLDVMMPRMDGIQVCRHLRADGRLASLPVALVTARGDSILAEGRAAGADDILQKPISPGELVQRVQALLTHSHQNGSHPIIG